MKKVIRIATKTFLVIVTFSCILLLTSGVLCNILSDEQIAVGAQIGFCIYCLALLGSVFMVARWTAERISYWRKRREMKNDSQINR